MSLIPQTHIRNFSIIAHIDHGKSTLADRMLEHTQTIEARNMQDQVLDNMDLERERGITIKMQPVRMEVQHKGELFALNLIDTPGHIDFSYEVSRALKAVEGTLLLVDATQGVQAQTLTTLEAAKAAGLKIIPVLSKVDSPRARIEDVSIELVDLLDCDFEDIVLTSGKTGEGVEELIARIVADVPAPKPIMEKPHQSARALVFDFEYSEHQGVIVYARMMDGEFKPGSQAVFIQANKSFKVSEVGHVVPVKRKAPALAQGEIGYIVTGIKEAGIVSVGDTLTIKNNQLDALGGYAEPAPVVWASVYPESQDEFDGLRLSLDRLRLHDSSLVFEEESSGILGRGFRCGFLGMLHLEIITERLKREFNMEIVITTPTVEYIVELKSGETETIYTPAHFPGHGDIASIQEPWVLLSILSPKEYLSGLMQLYFEHEGDVVDTKTYADGRVAFEVEMPLRELMRNFFDEIKSITAGYASVAYKPIGMRMAHVTRLDVLVAGESVPAFTRIVSEAKAQKEAEEAVEKLHKILPRQLFVVKIQGQIKGRIISSRSIRALKKDVTGHLYGGDITRKMKLREKQKKGKKRMAAQGKVNIPQDVFLKMVKRGE